VGLKRGDRLRHATKTEWGVGEVLEDELGRQVQVFFEDVGAKSFDAEHAKFVKLSGEDSQSDYLTALVAHYRAELAKPVARGTKPKPSFMSFGKAVENFLSYFPNGFRDPAYIDGPHNERAYKLVAHRLMAELLGPTPFARLLAERQYAEIADRAKKVVGRTNLISPYEKIWLSNSLVAASSQNRFADSLYAMLYGTGDPEARFTAYAETLGAIGAAKWPVATYFPFMALPNEHMFLKPVVTQEAAQVLGQEVNYRPELNWLTYRQVLALALRIRTELMKDGRTDLEPRDMIDVQSFIWVTAPGYFR
jgi:Protein of unknown function (DUF3553)